LQDSGGFVSKLRIVESHFSDDIHLIEAQRQWELAILRQKQDKVRNWVMAGICGLVAVVLAVIWLH
jgi:hypothetical protein